LQILHKDDYLIEKVQFSTFTLNDDVLLLIDFKVYIFDSKGYPIMVDMTLEDEARLEDPDVEVVRIQSSK